MKNMLLLLSLWLAGAVGAAERFDFVFSWGRVKDEESAHAYAEIGVTDVFATGEKGVAEAKKYGMRPYCGFGPCGPHRQELSVAEQEYMKGLKTSEGLRVSRCQFGGEPVTALDTCPEMIACFLSDTNCVMSKARMEKKLKDNPQAEGIAFDYIGYVNLHSCECADCRARLAASGKAPEVFFREALVSYINTMVDYARKLRPGIKVAIHLYPAFRPDPLYGRDIKADYVQETVAWYFQWPDEKISDYTRKILSAPHLAGAASIPFVGLNASQTSELAYKSPERLEAELKLILAAGGHQLAVCNGRDMVKPGYREVFQRHCRLQTEK